MTVNLEEMNDKQREEALVAMFTWVGSQGGRLPLKAFFARLNTFPTLFREIIHISKSKEGEPQVLLQPRAKDDPFFAGQWATTGVTLPVRFNTSMVAELHGEKETGISHDYKGHPEYVFCGSISLPNLAREHGEATVFGCDWGNTIPTIKDGVEWVNVNDIDRLPLVPHSRSIVQMVCDVLIQGARPHFVEYLGSK